MKYLFKHYTTLCGIVEIEAEDETKAMQQFQKLKISDFEWRSDPNRTDRTTYEVVLKDPPTFHNKS